MKIKRVHVKSFGCSANLADGEVLAGCLAQAGYRIVGSVDDADLVVYNTCAVKGPTENRAISVLKRVSPHKKLVVGGCLPLINYPRLCKEVRFDGVVGPAAGNMIVDVVRRVLEGEKIAKLEGAAGNMPSLDLPRLRLNPVVSIIPVNYGCLGSCAYCCVMFARGRLRSYGIDEIVDRVKKDLALGAREFWITSQDTACYGKERGTNLAKLLNTICAIEGDFRIRVGMMTPNATMDILDDLIQAFKDERIFRFLHLPVQSGDDQILKRMRRFYSVADFKAIASAFRASFPELTLSTDLICGFPSESEKAFNRTLELIDEIKPDIVNVSKFFARPRTLAAEMDDSVPLTEIKQRSTMAAKCAKKIALEKNHRWVGWAGEILIDEGGKVPGSWIGRNLAYKPIVVESSDSLLGRTLRVQVKKAFATYLEGKLIQ